MKKLVVCTVDVEAPTMFAFAGVDNDRFFVQADASGAFRVIGAPKHIDDSDTAPDINDLIERLDGAAEAKRLPKG